MSNPAVERLATAIEKSAGIRARHQAAGIGWTPHGCTRADYEAAAKELREAIGDLFLGPITLADESLTSIAEKIAARLSPTSSQDQGEKK